LRLGEALIELLQGYVVRRWLGFAFPCLLRGVEGLADLCSLSWRCLEGLGVGGGLSVECVGRLETAQRLAVQLDQLAFGGIVQVCCGLDLFLSCCR
jgi:hypothetical protein